MDFKNLKPFPEGFLWGASSSAYQCEGAYDEEGKTLSVSDTAPVPAGTTDFKVAIDHYHRFKEDIALMAEMGFKEFRFSIAWPRIIPNGSGEVNQVAVDHYHEVIDECLKYGIEPVVTLYHFDLPQVLQDRYHGWTDRQCIADFVEYCKVCFKEYGPKVKYFLTINEQNMMVLYQGHMYGDEKDVWKANHHMLVAQAQAMIECHKMCPNSKIGPAPNITAIYPASSSPLDNLAAMDWDQMRNRLFLDTAAFGEYPEALMNWWKDRGVAPEITEEDKAILKAGNPDFIAFNYYGAGCVKYVGLEEGEKLKAEAKEKKDFMTGLMTYPGLCTAVKNPLQEQTSYGMGIDPVGLRVTLRQLWERYHLPLLITENGCGVPDKLEEDGTIHDDYRIDYLRKHIIACREAITDGVDLMGYSPWSAFDLISTHQGITKRYGFIYVNRDEFDLKDMKRIRKDSFFWYKKVIESNGEVL
ncbi:MAG: glycoside hydrolase family 1 protein [Solobacterium sp.]|nr:glycoside hydrolase family 1 protein [Solobacterium sp.]